MNTKQLEDIKRFMHEIDLLKRPLAILCNPNKEQELRDALGNGYLYYSHWIVPEDTIYVVDRKQIENCYLEEG